VSRRANELREKSTLELHDLLTAAQQETITVRFQVATRQMSNYARLRQLRREIARLKFLMQERTLAEQAEQ
jgi:large subunit ribosomal protein L29